LLQGPLSRFGDTAANTGVLALLEDVALPPAAKTIAASVGAGLFRIFLMPVDAAKTIMQVGFSCHLPLLVTSQSRWHALASKASKGWHCEVLHLQHQPAFSLSALMLLA
jgi:hypothetical protein